MSVHSSFREGVAVVAESLWPPCRGESSESGMGNDSGFEHTSTEELYRRMKEALSTKKDIFFHSQGDPSASIGQAQQKLDVVYETPYQSHSSMEL